MLSGIKFIIASSLTERIWCRLMKSNRLQISCSSFCEITSANRDSSSLQINLSTLLMNADEYYYIEIWNTHFEFFAIDVNRASEYCITLKMINITLKSYDFYDKRENWRMSLSWLIYFKDGRQSWDLRRRTNLNALLKNCLLH